MRGSRGLQDQGNTHSGVQGWERGHFSGSGGNNWESDDGRVAGRRGQYILRSPFDDMLSAWEEAGIVAATVRPALLESHQVVGNSSP